MELVNMSNDELKKLEAQIVDEREKRKSRPIQVKLRVQGFRGNLAAHPNEEVRKSAKTTFARLLKYIDDVLCKDATVVECEEILNSLVELNPRDANDTNAN